MRGVAQAFRRVIGGDPIVVGAASSFLPSSIAGLKAWFDMLDSTAFTQVAGAMTSITNKASSVVWSAGTMPAYAATGLAGHPCMDFDGSTHFITDTEAAVWAALQDAHAYTLFLVADADTAGRTEHIFSVADEAQVTNRNRTWGKSSANLWRTQSINDAGTTITVTSAGASDLNPHRQCWHSPGTTVSLTTDGAADDPNAANMNPGTLTPERNGIGARVRTTPDQFYDGKIGEIILYDSLLSDAQITQVLNYLTRWS